MNREELESKLQEEPSVTDLQNLHDAIREHTGLYVPNRPVEVEDWWERKKSVVMRRLNPEEEEETQDDNDNETDNE